MLVDRRYQTLVVDIERSMDTPEQATPMTPRLTAIPGLPPLLACLGLLALWELAARVFQIGGLPPAHEALRQLPAILGDREALFNIANSVRRMVIGFSLALLFAVPVGLLMGRSRLVAAFFNPLLMIIYPVPKAALMPIIMLWLGVGDASKTLVIFLGVSLPIIYHSYQGARAVEEKMLWSAAAMGMSALQRLMRIVLPSALPEIFVGVRTGLVLALITMVTSEMIARQAGVGNILFNSLDMALYDTVYAMIVIIGALGFIIDRPVRAAARLARRLGRACERDRGGHVMNPARHSRSLAGRPAHRVDSRPLAGPDQRRDGAAFAPAAARWPFSGGWPSSSASPPFSGMRLPHCSDCSQAFPSRS